MDINNLIPGQKYFIKWTYKDLYKNTSFKDSQYIIVLEGWTLLKKNFIFFITFL